MSEQSRRKKLLIYSVLVLGTALVTLIITAVLVTIFEHKQEARTPFVRVVEVGETSTDPAPWGMNWPHHYDEYLKTASGAEYGGSSAMTASKLDQYPWLRRLYAGYAFSLDYREARGHAYMLSDQQATERVTKRKQAGACLHCHASMTVMWRKVGLEQQGKPSDEAALAAAFDMDAVIAGFQAVSQKPYHEMLALLQQAPDGTPGQPPSAHPVSCIDCHDPTTMKTRVTRPGFVLGIAALAAGEAPVPHHLPSIARWRAGDRERPYDPNRDATRQEMRSFVCGQCHVEYYCANKMTLTFPWGNGLNADDLERYWEELTFSDGTPFYDYEHGETGAKVFKVQHPEFELWSQGIHARAGVGCADCHMPYERMGAMKVSSHDVRSPVSDLRAACGTCHVEDPGELEARIDIIQGRTMALMARAATAMTDMLDAINAAKAAGATPEQLAPIFALQRRSMWRLDYFSSENSKGFHADQEAARMLGESIDYSRQAQARALQLRAPAVTAGEPPPPREPILGVTPTEDAPLSPRKTPNE